MSWLFNSLQQQPHDDNDDDPSSSRAKNDLSLLTQTLGRQLRGVATFLAPPPANDAVPSSDSPPHSPPQSQPLLGIRNDLAEFGGSFKNSLSLLSSTKAVTGISNFASNLLQRPNNAADDVDDDDDDDDAEDVADVSAPGITDEVLGFVTEISVLPDYWTGFPIPLDHEDFRMCDAQREHASAVEQLVPGLADLRVGICSSMSEEQFWMIYFLLLLPRLNEDDFELLSTPKIVEARDALLHKLQNKKNTEVINTAEKRKTQGEDISSREKEALTEMVNTAERLKIDDEESTEHWSEEASISSGSFVDGQTKLEPEEDISFSDLEDDEKDLSSELSGQRRGQNVRASSPNGSNDWVQLKRSSEIEGGQQNAGRSKEKDSEGEDSSDWLAVDEFD